MAAIPDLKETTKGKQDLLAFNHAISEALSKTCTPDFDCEGLILSHADSIIRTDTLVKQNTFSRTFSPDSQKNSVPVSLTAFISLFVCFITKSFLTYSFFFHLHLLYQPYLGLCQAQCVQSHQRQPMSAVAITACEVQVSAADSRTVPTVATGV